MGGGFGSGTNKLGNTAPGTVDPFSQALLAQNTGFAEQAMHNRYQQLGLGVPSGGTGAGPHGAAAQAAAGGTSLQYGSPGIPEQMDIGSMPSLVGGIQGMSEATLGQMQNNALSAGGGGGGGKGGGGLGGLGSLGMLAAK
jgi:hypothetical protein